MKKVLLFAIALTIGAVGFSQQRTHFTKTQQTNAEQRVFVRPSDEIINLEKPVNATVQHRLMPTETQLGTTYYDKQSNSSLSNRFYRYEDGTMAAVWTRGMTATAYADRGTGYNYFDGTAWGPEPTARIENQRTGWPSYAPLGTNGEMVVAHLATDLLISSRAEKGTGAWTQNTYAGPGGSVKLTWPKVITAGTDHNSIHLLANSYAEYLGQTAAMLYSRSQDGGLTWDINNVVLPGTGSDSYTEISADDYVWAEPKNGVLAFVCASQFYDMFLMKSTDNGTTWTKTVIWANPYPMWNWETTITTDTIWCPDGTANVALDNAGKAHVVFGIGRVAHTEAGTTYSFWPYTDGIGYWNEDMEPFTNTNQHKALSTTENLIENVNLIGWSQDVDGNGTLDFLTDMFTYNAEIGISTMPTICIDDQNKIFVGYASTTENFDNGTYNYKHLWARNSPDDGATWGPFVDVTSDILHAYDECIFPLFTDRTDADNIHLFYQADETPGLSLDDNHAAAENRIIYSQIPKSDIVGIDSKPVLAKNLVVSANFPNPVVSTSVVNVELPVACNVSLNVYTLTGVSVYKIDAGFLNAGTHQLVIDAENLVPGVYFYTVSAGNEKVTRKMIVNR